MSEARRETHGYGGFLVEPGALGSDVRRYALSLIVVVALGAGVMALIGLHASGDVASDVESAVMIDLPPAEASSAPASDAADGPQQQAAQASDARQAPDTTEQPKDLTKPVDDLKPAPKAEPVEQPPVAADPLAVLERKQEAPTPSQVVAAPASQAHIERAPSGSDRPAKTVGSQTDESRTQASRHAITSWQRSLLQRLDTARRHAARQPHAIGTVKIAFSIDLHGALASEHVEAGSGSSALDQAALLIVRQAAPFAAPPAGSGSRDTLFILAIRFR